MISRTELFRLLRYEPDTGFFFWRVYRSRGAYAGDKAGTISAHGYVIINIRKKLYRAHRLAWFYVNGRWPDADLDHINGVRTDNRWANLRQATRSQNNGNSVAKSTNTSGYKGVYFRKDRDRWSASISLGNKTKNLGVFDTAEAARDAYALAARKHFGEFARL